MGATITAGLVDCLVPPCQIQQLLRLGLLRRWPRVVMDSMPLSLFPECLQALTLGKRVAMREAILGGRKLPSERIT